MDIGKINQILANSNKHKIDSIIKRTEGVEKQGLFDNIDISSEAGKMSAKALAKDAVLELQSSLVATLTMDGIGNKNNGLYNLLDTPMDKFIKVRFNGLTTDTKKEFMNIFSALAQTSGGIVSESIINQTFGNSGRGFGDMVNQITQQLNKYLG